MSSFLINNHFLLGSPHYGTIPFVQFNGNFIEGSENIMKSLDHLGMKLERNSNENQIIGIVNEILIPILMEDRTIKINGKCGLDFLNSDNGIRKQLIKNLPEFMGSKYIQIAIENFGYILAINSNFWQEYFQLNLSDALTDTDEKKIILFMKKYIKPVMGSFDMGDWQRLNNWLKEFIDEILQKYFNGDEEGSMFTKVNV
uniref:Uncharacterized protein n=1 Tax=Meloidogyne enterolobii TaxID=390850 RepID=A0A6V7VUD3_MELEN|nr:unnamed protein product [Meloidogyne enterolobii]